MIFIILAGGSVVMPLAGHPPSRALVERRGVVPVGHGSGVPLRIMGRDRRVIHPVGHSAIVAAHPLGTAYYHEVCGRQYSLQDLEGQL